jgi:hypothetical protein
MRNTMLCIAAVVGCLALGVSNVDAQMKTGSSGPRVMIGPFAGLNYTTVSGTDFSDPGYRAGLAAGGQLQADFDGGLFFRMAALYSMRGAKATEEGVDATLKENYVEFPLLLGYAFGTDAGTMKPFIMAGGQVGFKVSCDLKGEDSGTSVSVKCEDFTDDIASIDYGALGGAGVLFPVSSGTMSIDARYYVGLHDLGKDSDTKHRGFTVGIAYMIPIGH